MAYVDGFVVPVPHGNKEAYRDLAQRSAEMFIEFGALRLVECWGHDVPDGKVTDFKGAVKVENGENVVFAWITWPSKEIRDAAHEKMRTDPRMANMTMPFDGKRMIYGGFEVLVDSGGAA